MSDFNTGQTEVQKLINSEVIFDKNDNYYRQVWKFYLDNEQLLKEVQDTASENLKCLKRIYNIENYYETSLLPKLLSFPKQYLNRIKMVRHQQQVQEKKIEAKLSTQ